MVTKKTAIVLIVLALLMFAVSIYLNSMDVEEQPVSEVQVQEGDLEPVSEGGQLSIIVNPPGE